MKAALVLVGAAAAAMATAAAAVSISTSAQQQQQQQAIFQNSIALTRIHTPSLQALHHLHAHASRNSDNLDVWATHAAGCASSTASSSICAIDIASTADDLSAYLHGINSTAGEQHTLIADVHALAQQQQQQAHIDAFQARQYDQPRYDEAWHERYHSYEDIQDYLQHLAATHPSHAQLVELGTTHENRSLTALKLGHFDADARASAEDPAKPKLGVLVMANQHAREWISGATALHLIHQILSDELSSEAQDGAEVSRRRRRKKGHLRGDGGQAWSGGVDLLNVFDITVLPLANPDGYAYSWESERMWRKNRQPIEESDCVGIDINSNWDAHFHPWPVSQACQESFPGTRAFEARESDAIARFIADPANNIHSVVDLHSYGQLLTYPFAFSCSPSLSLPDEEDLLELSFGAVKAMRDVHSKTFHAGRHCELAWELRGSALDWSYGWFPPAFSPPDEEEDDEQLVTAAAAVRGKMRSPRRKPIAPSSLPTLSDVSTSSLQPRSGNLVKWSFALELRDGGTYGFLLPPEQIRASGEEAGALMRYSLEFIGKRERRL
ncbi:hypothetical protein V8E36_002356 [Tilletia maclaganii]